MTDAETPYKKYLARKRQKQAQNPGSRAKPASANFMLRQVTMAMAANSPIHECLVPEALFENGMGNLVFSRRLPDGSIAVAMFLLDVFCLGVKNAFFATVTRGEYERSRSARMAAEKLQPMEPEAFRKLVEEGVAYARDLGFSPHNDYAEARRIFGDLNTADCQGHFEYGRDGKPFYISGPHETPAQARKVVEQLEQRLGPGNFDFLVVA